MLRFVFIALCLVGAVSRLLGQIPAFPGAEGFGAYATGGRGGDVYIVTNTNSSGPGSFYEGVTTIPASGRTIVFAVSGAIHLAGGVATRVTANKLTIAGQTAPGDGVLFKDGTIRFSSDDIVVRHIRVRHGVGGSGGDCINLDSGCQNAILDHISMQFSADENMSSFGSPPENLTLQWSINSWGLMPHSMGGLWDQNHATCHHTLWSHNNSRNPKSRPNGLLEWTNNVTFDWGIGFIMGDSNTPAAWKANVIGNYFVCPPGNIRTWALQKGWLDRNATRRPNFTVHVGNNLHDINGDGVLNGVDRGYDIVQGQEYNPAEVVPDVATAPDFPRYYKSVSPIAGSALLTIDPPLLAYKKLLSASGALRLDAAHTGAVRDEVDARAMSNVTAQTQNMISSEAALGLPNNGFGTFAAATAPIDSDRDGMPDNYEAALGWNSATQDHNTTVSGSTYFPAGFPAAYTRLEEYLHFKSVPHLLMLKNTATSPDIDLSRYTAGFADSPVFTLANVSGGTATQSGTGGKFVHFTAQATAGRGGFDFTVTDAAGSSWTQRFAICIVNSLEPSDLVWQGNGTSTATWDTASSFWRHDGTPTPFTGGDRVTFDATGATSATVSVPAAVAASVIEVNAATNYTFNGAGSISSSGTLTKRGSGTMTLNNAATNSFGAVRIEQGSVQANVVGSLGVAKVTFAGGNLGLAPNSNTTMTSALEFLAPATISPTTQHTVSGNWTGTNQTVTLTGNSSLWTVAGTWTGFSGRISFGGGSLKMRLNGTTNTNFGSTAVAIDLGSNNAQLMNRNGITVNLGSLESTGANTQLQGAQTGTTASTYSIGALNTDTTFAGVIANGGSGGLTHITKVGSGTWTLSGASTYTGSTSVSAGKLLVNGSLGATAVSVSSGATLGGGGSLSGVLTAQTGSNLAPGPSLGAVGTLAVNGGLTLAGTTNLHFDLSNVSSSGNDKITVSGGTLTLNSAVVNVNVNLLNGELGAGTYALIDGNAAMAASPAPTLNLIGLPSGSRQTFTLERAANGATPAFVNLVVAGTPPAALVWSGSGGANWDLNSTSNFSGGPTNTFFNFDTVTFDNTGITGAVTLVGSLSPRNLIVSASTRAYTFSGSGMIGGNGSLTKSGAASLTITPTMLSISTTTNATNQATVSTTDAANVVVGMAIVGAGFPLGTVVTAIDAGTGTITFSQASTTTATATASFQARNSFTGGTTISGGSIVLTNEAANRWGLGTGAVTFNGGTLILAGVTGSNGIDTQTFPNDLIVPAGQSGTLQMMQRGRISGRLTGGGTLNLVVKYIRGDHYGDWSDFTGQINVTAAQSGSEFRLAENYAPDGFPNCAVNLGSNVTFKHTGILNSGAGTTIEIGELGGVSGSLLQGGVTGGRAMTYRIGGKNTSATFAGNITEQSASTLTNYVKTGSGMWTISGTNAWAGGTIVEAGTLCISGSTSSAGAVQVASGASLCLTNGTLITDAVNLADGATLTGTGTIDADLNISGTASVTSTTGGSLTVTGAIVNNGTLRIAGSTSFTATGTFVNNGVLDLLTSASSLPANFENNGIVIENTQRTITSAVKTGNDFTCSCIGYAGHTYQLQYSETLTGPWINSGAPVNGTGTTIQWNVTNGGTGDRKFYRVLVTP
jgi:autotransporter-associated beta strand protein